MRHRFGSLSLVACSFLVAARLAAAQDRPAVTIDPEDVHAKAGIKCEQCHSTPGPEQFAKVPPDKIAAVCAQCHVREAEFFDKSPKKIAWLKVGLPACVMCHTSHAVKRPSDGLIGTKPPALCAMCHVEGAKGTSVVKAYQDSLGNLNDAITQADQLLSRAEVAGMLVDDGRTALRGAREQQVLARVAVHAFHETPLVDTAKQGVAAAKKAEAAGNEALAELRFRRQGLAVATIMILGFLGALWVKIRRLPPA